MATSRRDGFTLVELIIVYSIICTLVAVGGPTRKEYSSTRRAQDCLGRLGAVSTDISALPADLNPAEQAGIFHLSGSEAARWLYPGDKNCFLKCEEGGGTLLIRA